MMQSTLLGIAAAGLVAAAPLATPASAYYPESCPPGDMCVYSQEIYKGNEISSPPFIPIDIPANFGGVHSWYNNTDARWCALLSNSAKTAIQPYSYSDRSAQFQIVHLDANGGC